MELAPGLGDKIVMGEGEGEGGVTGYSSPQTLPKQNAGVNQRYWSENSIESEEICLVWELHQSNWENSWVLTVS